MNNYCLLNFASKAKPKAIKTLLSYCISIFMRELVLCKEYHIYDSLLDIIGSASLSFPLFAAESFFIKAEHLKYVQTKRVIFPEDSISISTVLNFEKTLIVSTMNENTTFTVLYRL